MKHLAKFLLAVLLLTVTAVSWGACPEGQKQTYKGCEVDATPKISWAACPEGYKSNYKGECVDASGNAPKYLRDFNAASVLFDKEDDGYGTFIDFEYHGRNAHKEVRRKRSQQNRQSSSPSRGSEYSL